MNNPSSKELAYENIADQFDDVMNEYDVKTRLNLVYNDLLKNHKLNGLNLLDAGCGTGWFSKYAHDRGAIVTSMDLGKGLLSQVAKKCPSNCVIGSISEMPFEDESFDVVVSSEVIEHVEDQRNAFNELSRVLKHDGILVITTPNKLWYPSVWLANKFSMRPYQGLEKWLSWSQFAKNLQNVGFKIEKKTGCHLLPFQWSILHPLLRKADKMNHLLYPFMINMGVIATKKVQ